MTADPRASPYALASKDTGGPRDCRATCPFCEQQLTTALPRHLPCDAVEQQGGGDS